MTALLEPPTIIRPRATPARPSTWDAPETSGVLNESGEPLRVLNVHNRHAGPGGFEVFYEGVTGILRDHGHHVVEHERDSSQIVTLGQKASAFQTAIASPTARREMTAMIEREQIDLVHLNNVWPLVSPSVVEGCGDAYGGRGVPVTMSMQDYKLTCPAGQHVRHGKVCTKCVGGREYWAAIHGCRENRVWSTAYAIRNVVARRRGTFQKGVTLFLPCSNFVRDHLVGAGFDAKQTHVLPDFTDLPDPGVIDADAKGIAPYAAYVGRISPEKGLPTMIEAARRTGIPLRIAGDATKMPELQNSLPPNVQFVGMVSRRELVDFYRQARFTIVPSEWLECFGIVSAEAQGYGTPVIATRMGGLPEVVVDGETGLIVPPGDPAAMASAMRKLWDDPTLVSQMSRNARERALREFTPEIFFRRLAAAFARAVSLHGEAHVQH